MTPNQKVIITPHDPQLPMGPNPFVTFPLPYPMTPLSAGTPAVSHENLLIRPVEPATAIALREQEQHQLALWQQHQQQQWLHAVHQQQKQLQAQFTPHLPPPHANNPHPAMAGPHPTASHLPFAPAPSHAHPSHSQSRPNPHSVEVSSSQPMAFNFPSPEEMMRHQHRLAQMGIPPEAIAMGVLPPGIAPGVPLEHSHLVKLEEHHHQQQALAAAMAAGGGVHLVPSMPHVNMELLLQQQQQQAALAAAAQASGVSPLVAPTAENIMDFQRQLEAVMQQAQKDPQVLQNPHIQQMLAHHQRIMAVHQHQVQGAAMQEQFMQNYQQKMQEMFLQQQQELHKHFAAGVRAPHEDGRGRGDRPPVIVQPK